MNYNKHILIENVDMLERLQDYCGKDYVPMHMPGSKRNTELFQMENPYGIDITEIDGFDNMHHATDIIKHSFEKAAKMFGAEETLFLVNGSSAGILSAICGATKKGDHILVSRNCHVSVYNAIYLNELTPVYIYPEKFIESFSEKCKKEHKYVYKLEYKDKSEYKGKSEEECKDREKTIKEMSVDAEIYGAVSPKEIEKKLLEDSKITAVVITSPTYEGIVSDVEKIAEIVHKYGKILIVDEAHGAHFNFHEIFPKSAVKCGADAVIQSIHKTLPAFTQTALLHLNGTNINRNKVKRYWNIYQSTSPSYILMAGIDRCLSILEYQGNVLFEQYVQRLLKLRERLEKLNNIELLSVDDISKIVLITKNGKKLHDILLNQYHIELEMSSLRYIIAMTSIGDKNEYYERFADALEEIDGLIEDGKLPELKMKFIDGSYKKKNINMLSKKCDMEKSNFNKNVLCEAKVRSNIYDAVIKSDDSAEIVNIKNALQRISAATICFYPPGIPVINPGEEFTEKVISYIEEGIAAELEVMGLVDDYVETIANTGQSGCKKDKINDIIQKSTEKEVYVLCLK